MKIRLTQKAVAKLKAPTASGRQELVWDETLRGFGVLLQRQDKCPELHLPARSPDRQGAARHHRRCCRDEVGGSQG